MTTRQFDRRSTAALAAAAFLLSAAADPAANRDLGLSLVRRGDLAAAAKPLEAAAKDGPSDRSLTLALAAVRVSTGNPMRAVKGLCDYLQSHPKPADEPVIDALAVALAKAGDQSASAPLFQQGVAAYAKANAALEATRPGERRWGTEWHPAKTVAKRMAAWQQARADLVEAATKVAQLERDRQAALDRVTSNSVALGHTNAKARRNAIAHDRDLAKDLANEQPAAQRKLEGARAKLAATPGPPFPDAVALDSLDQPAPSLATAAPVPARAAVPPAVKSHPKVNKPAPKPDAVPDAEPVDPPTPPPVVAAAPESRRAVGFAVAPDLIVTTAAAVADANRVHINLPNGMSFDGRVVRADANLGLALLRVAGADLSCLTLATTVKPGAIRCGGFPTATMFGDAAHLMSGTVDGSPVDGKPWTVTLSEPPRLAGGPLLAVDGSVVGVELGDAKSAAGVPAVPVGALRQFVATDARATDVATDPRKAIVQVVADRD